MSTFEGNIDGRIVIPGTHTGEGGTTNFNFGYHPSHDRYDRPRKPFSTVPFAPDADFVDRPDIIAWVRTKCAKPGARAALVGLGGVGKSQLAIQHAHQIRDAAQDTYVFWVHASTRARFEEAYRGIADKLQLLDHRKPTVDVLRLVSDWLCDEANGRWTMVIDNADDGETFFPLPQHDQNRAIEGQSVSLADYVPQTRNGSILITSRSRDVAARLAGGYHNTKEVLAMDENQGLELLGNKLATVPTDQSAAIELVRILDCMPLAITQAAAYINRGAQMTIARYIREFRANDERRESLLNCDAGDLRRDRTAANSVVTTWQMSFEHIQHERLSAANLLSLMSFFNPQEIPEKTLRSYGRTSARAETGDDLDNADRLFDKDLDILYAYSLVNVIPEKAAYEMHPLVQFCTKIWLSSIGEVELWRRQFFLLLATEFPSGEFETWAECQRLLPHIEPWFNSELKCEETAKSLARVLANTAWYLNLKGSYEVAQSVAANALTIREQIFGADHKETLESMEKIAPVLWNQGKYNEAEKLSRRVLVERKKRLGENHPDTLVSMSNLVIVLQAQQNFEEAEKLAWQALTKRESVLGEHHPSTLTSMDTLASVLWGQGKYDEAEKLDRQVLAAREKKLGEHHLNTLTSMGNLVTVLESQEKYDEAEELAWQALAKREKVLGEQHSLTLLAVWNLAHILRRMKRSEEAAPLYQRAHNGFTQSLGSQHPWTVDCGKWRLLNQQEAKQAVPAENGRPVDKRHSLVGRTVRKLSKRLPIRD